MKLKQSFTGLLVPRCWILQAMLLVHRVRKAGKILTSEAFFEFYRTKQEDISRSTSNWRISQLVKNGELVRVGQGRFTWGAENKFVPVIQSRHQQLYSKIKEHFPFIRYCIWETEMVKPFQQHLPRFNFILVDVEKELMESVFLFLKESFEHVYLKPDTSLIQHYIMELEESIIIRHLITEAPVLVIDDISTTITLEKMLVDLSSDSEFEFLKGGELATVFKNALDQYSANYSKLLRYARRKGQWERITGLLKASGAIVPALF